MKLFNKKNRKKETQSVNKGYETWDKEQLVDYLLTNGSFDDVGRVLEHIKNVMILQNDISRPTYIIEVDANLTKENIGVIASSLRTAGVSAVLVPVKVLNVVAQVTPDSLGVENGGLYNDVMKHAQNASVAAETLEREMSKEE
jgi:hypothetical protein